jgi:hypothetical protein
MILEFELRPADSRAFEAWAAHKYLRFTPTLRALVLLSFLVGFAVWYRHPGLLGLSGDAAFFAIPLSLELAAIALALLLKRIVTSRARMATGVVEGTHAMHFSEAGVHHVGPLGINRHGWTEFRSVEVTVSYLFLRFTRGTIAIPVSALGRFAPDYDEAFLAELVPLIQAAAAGPA